MRWFEYQWPIFRKTQRWIVKSIACFLLLLSQLEAHEAVSDYNTSLSAELLKTLYEADKNLLISPFSIQNSLMALYMGSDTMSEVEIKRALKLNQQKDEELEALANIRSVLADNKWRNLLSFSHAIWLHSPHEIEEEYASLVKSHLQVDIENCDLTLPPYAKGRINDWASQKSKKKIPQFFNETPYEASTRAILTDIATMKSSWKYPFKVKEGVDDLFFCEREGSPPQKQSYMTRSGTHDYFENDKLQLLSLDLNNNLQFMILLPKDQKLDKSLNEFKSVILDLAAYEEKLSPTPIYIQIPKFSFSKQSNLNQAMMSLGIIKSFTRRGDFSNMTKNSSLYLSNLLHHSYININEWGIDGTSSLFAVAKDHQIKHDKVSHNFIANRPFLYLVLDTKHHIVLFLGTYTNNPS